MDVEGVLNMTCELNGNSATIRVIISKHVTDEFLISETALKKLRVISWNFPFDTVRQVKSEKCLTEEIQEEYKDIMSDELNPIPMKTEKEMHINITSKNVIPKKVTGARRIPLRWMKEANKTIQDLIDKKVIVEVKETTDWCSPAFFVPKSDKVRMRLVTDYTELNKFVKRPVHPFPSTKEILQAIPSKKEASIFAKLDAVHGYFQLALDQQSSYITTFLLPQGKFRYLRAPMGLNASSDEWC